MPKRFTDTEKWKDDWYISLSNDDKIVWQWLLDNCTHAGVCKRSIGILNLMCQVKYTEDEMISKMDGRVIVSDNFWFIPKFIKFQYPTLLSKKPVIVSLIKELTAKNLLKFVPELCNNNSQIVEEQLNNETEIIEEQLQDLDEIIQEQIDNSSETIPEQLNNYSGTISEQLNNYSGTIPEQLNNYSGIVKVKDKVKDKVKVKVKVNLEKGGMGGKTKPPDVYSRMVESWFKFFEDEFGLRPKFSSMDGKKIKSIRDYLARQIPEQGEQGQEKLIEVWELILSSVPKHEFIHKNPSLNLIESKLNELMILVKSPRNRIDQHDQSTAGALRILHERNKKNILNDEHRKLEIGAISEVN
ncbi:MAG TPA: hypothetical protein PK210_05145 [Bacteroidia bacterium]|nr:hypothetical protein [Bacteroidia bacterium]